MKSVPYYESERGLSEYLLFHYGTAAEVLPWKFGPANSLNYPARCVSELLNVEGLGEHARGLDLGCAVGRSSFELARHCREVIGMDLSRSFIQAASQLKREGEFPFRYPNEGELMMEAIAKVPPEIDRSRVRFECGDAQQVSTALGQFDVVLLANLVDRLPEPRRCLEALRHLVRQGGQAIITTPCTWVEEYTERSQWLGGFEQGGKAIRTIDSLRANLSSGFELEARCDLPFLIREHARKFQWSVAMGTRWRRCSSD